MKKRKIIISLFVIASVTLNIMFLLPTSEVVESTKVENKKMAMYMLDGPNGNVTGKINSIQPNYILDENRTVCTGAPGVFGEITLVNQKLNLKTNGSVSCKVYFYTYNVSITKSGSGTISATDLSIPNGGSATLTVTPDSGYYLSSATCTNDFTTNAVTGTSATSEQTVTISNTNNQSSSACSFTFAKKSGIACVNSSTNAQQACGTITTGTKIAIGDENPQRFWVISNDGTNIRALAEYNLYVGSIYNGSTKQSDIATTDSRYGLQNSSAKGWISGASPDIRTATVPFNSATYSTVAYTQYNADGTTSSISANSGYTNYAQATIKSYVDAYRTKINGSAYANGMIKSADLITFPELIALGCTRTEQGGASNTCNNSSYSWIKDTSFWSGSARNHTRVWNVDSNGLFGYNYYTDNYSRGVRPVITISASSF